MTRPRRFDRYNASQEGVFGAHNLLVGTSGIAHWVIPLGYKQPGLTVADMDSWEDRLDDFGATVAANPAVGTVCITLHMDAVSTISRLRHRVLARRRDRPATDRGRDRALC